MVKIARGKKAEMLAKAFGLRLKKTREERFLSQRQLAEAIGIQTVQISRYERGIALPNADTLAGLAEHLRVSVGGLLLGDEEKNGEQPPIQDVSLLERFRDLEKLDRKDREMVINLIDAVISSRQHEQVTTRRRRSA